MDCWRLLNSIPSPLPMWPHCPWPRLTFLPPYSSLLAPPFCHQSNGPESNLTYPGPFEILCLKTISIWSLRNRPAAEETVPAGVKSAPPHLPPAFHENLLISITMLAGFGSWFHLFSRFYVRTLLKGPWHLQVWPLTDSAEMLSVTYFVTGFGFHLYLPHAALLDPTHRPLLVSFLLMSTLL